MITGTITRVDRTANLCYYVPHPLPSQIESTNTQPMQPDEHQAAWIGRQWPCPLTDWYFTNDGQVAVGPTTGYPEEIIYDHFTYDTSSPVEGDTPWGSTILGGGVGAGTGFLAATGLGVKQVRCRDAINASTSIEKSALTILAGSAPAHWIVQKLGMTESILSLDIIAGVHDAAFSNGVDVCIDTSAGQVWQLRTAAGGVATLTTAEKTLTLDEHLWTDIVYVPRDPLSTEGGWAALWIDGSGPYWTTSNVPPTSATFSPGLFISTASAANKTLACDVYGYWSVPHAHNPGVLGIDA